MYFYFKDLHDLEAETLLCDTFKVSPVQHVNDGTTTSFVSLYVNYFISSLTVPWIFLKSEN